MIAPSYSMGVSCVFFRNEVGVLHACLGIDIQSARPAPVGKRFGVDVGAHNDVSVAAHLLLSSLGFHPPYVERVGELVAIGHDPADGVVIFGTVPNHPGNTNDGLFHGSAFQ